MSVKSLQNRRDVLAQAVRRFTSWLDRDPRHALMVTLLLALLPGAAMLWRLQSGPGEVYGLWSQIALNLANGQGYVGCEPAYFPLCGPANQMTAAREPLPVLLFAALLRVAGSFQPYAMIMELILNLAILVGVFSIARELGGGRAAFLAGLIWALYLPAVRIFYPAIAGDALATLTITWALFFFLRATATGRSRDWLLSGACLGLGVLSRSSAIILLPVLAFCALVRPGPGLVPLSWSLPSVKERLRPPALLLVASVVLVIPWMTRNYLVFDRVVVGTTLAGYNLFRHNSALLTEDYLRYVGPEEGREVVQELLARRPDLRGTETEAQMDAVYRQEAMRIISAAPDRYLRLSAYRFLLLWFNWRIEESYGKPGIRLLDAVTMLQQGALLFLGLVGMLVSGWRARPLYFSIGAFILVHLAVMGRLYHLMPVMPLVVVLSALGGLWLLQQARSAWRPVGLPVAGGRVGREG